MHDPVVSEEANPKEIVELVVVKSHSEQSVKLPPLRLAMF